MHTYTGAHEQVYPQYLDADRDCTLHAEPGGSYRIRPALGSEHLPVPPDDRWKSARPGKSTGDS